MLRLISLAIACLAMNSNADAMEVRSFDAPAGQLVVSPGMPSPSGFHHGYVEFDHSQEQCVTAEERTEIRALLAKSRRELIALGKLKSPDPKAVVLFQWPLAGAPENGFADESYYGVSNFVDQNPTAALLDYNCTTRTYNGHRGTDYFLWPFWWHKKNHQHVKAVAPADGTIIFKSDSNADNHCSCSGSWNAVYLEHADGSVTWSGHLRAGSLTPKLVGQAVVAGEVLGSVASSGCSTGPHLHLEVYDALDNLIDPYAGTCNSLNAGSWWQSQKPFYDSGVNAVMTHSGQPVFPACPGEETINEQLEFPGSNPSVWLGVYYRDQLSSQVSNYRILRPDNSVYAAWNHNSDQHYQASYWIWNYNLGPLPPAGVWTFEVTHLGNTYTQRFGVGTSALGVDELAAAHVLELNSFPNPFTRNTEIRFALPSSGPARLAVYDLGGHRVRTLLDAVAVAGPGVALWDGRDDRGSRVGTGIYFYRLDSAGMSIANRATLVR